MSASDAKVAAGGADVTGNEVAVTADMLFGPGTVSTGTVSARSEDDHLPALASGTAGVNSLVRGVAGLLFLEHFPSLALSTLIFAVPGAQETVDSVINYSSFAWYFAAAFLILMYLTVFCLPIVGDTTRMSSGARWAIFAYLSCIEALTVVVALILVRDSSVVVLTLGSSCTALAVLVLVSCQRNFKTVHWWMLVVLELVVAGVTALALVPEIPVAKRPGDKGWLWSALVSGTFIAWSFWVIRFLALTELHSDRRPLAGALLVSELFGLFLVHYNYHYITCAPVDRSEEGKALQTQAELDWRRAQVDAAQAGDKSDGISVRFWNRLSVPVDLVWENGSAQGVLVATITAGASISISTHAGHVMKAYLAPETAYQLNAAQRQRGSLVYQLTATQAMRGQGYQAEILSTPL